MSKLAYWMRQATAIARGSDAVVARASLLDQGVPEHRIDRLAELGHLVPVIPGVYLVGSDRLSQRQLERAGAQLEPGRTWLAGRSSLSPREVLWAKYGTVRVCTTARVAERSDREAILPTAVRMEDESQGVVRVRRLVRRPPADVVDGLGCTSVARALVDVAADEGQKILGIAWRQAEFRGLLDAAELARETEGPRRSGVDELRELVHRRKILTDASSVVLSKGELRFLHRIVEAGLPRPQMNPLICVGGQWFRPDFYWPELAFALELDTPDHLSPAAGARDRARDQHFFVHGIDVLRFLQSEADNAPDEHVRLLALALDRQRQRRAAAA